MIKYEHSIPEFFIASFIFESSIVYSQGTINKKIKHYDTNIIGDIINLIIKLNLFFIE